MRYVFFTVNDFTREGGGTIRMYGVLNELAKQGNNITLISNAKNLVKFEKNIKHIGLGHPVAVREKRIFQTIAGLFPPSVVGVRFSALLNKIKEVVVQNSLGSDNIIFFEYLDNSIAYVLKKRGVISGYTNDLHGIVPVEFKFQADHAKSSREKFKFLFKYHVANILDAKVFNAAYGLIFASEAMRKYFVGLYPGITTAKNIIIPYVLSSDAFFQSVDPDLKAKLLVDLNIKERDRIILFAGAFKKTGGVPDLIEAFSNLITRQKDIKLVLVGDGPKMAECNALVAQMGIEDKVHFTGRTQYHHLRTYQDIAPIIVCPDKMNVYSDLIIHVKYLDALLSGKIVVNGSFRSVKEVNIDDALSVSFQPSDINSLTNALEYCLNNLSALQEKYKDNPQYASKNLTYSSFVEQFKQIAT